MPHRTATSEILQLLADLPLDTLAAVGRIMALWAHLECEFDLAIKCLLTNRKAEGLHDDHLALPFVRRLEILRAAGRRVYDPRVFAEFERVLGAVANAHGKRALIVHGRIVPGGEGRIDVEEHRHTGRDGSWRVTTRAYTLKRLIGIGNDIAKAAGRFVAFNRRTFPVCRPRGSTGDQAPEGFRLPRSRSAAESHSIDLHAEKPDGVLVPEQIAPCTERLFSRSSPMEPAAAKPARRSVDIGDRLSAWGGGIRTSHQN
jgi:hypothetical protein